MGTLYLGTLHFSTWYSAQQGSAQMLAGETYDTPFRLGKPCLPCSRSYSSHCSAKEVGYSFHILRGVCLIGFAVFGAVYLPEHVRQVL